MNYIKKIFKNDKDEYISFPSTDDNITCENGQKLRDVLDNFTTDDLNDTTYSKLNTTNKTVIGSINEVNDGVKKAQENQINLIEDDTSMKGISDIEHGTLETNDKTIIGAINEVNTQIEDIAKQTITTEERNKLTNLENYDDSSIKNDIQVQKARIDNLTTLQEGSTTGDAELIDARIGIDGITYENLGSSIREQLSCLSDFSRFINLYNPDNITENKFIEYSSGKAKDYTSENPYCITDYINIHSNTILAIKDMMAMHFAFYDSNKNNITNKTNSYTEFNGGTNYNKSGWNYMTSPENAKYIRFTLRKSDIGNAAVIEVTTMDNITESLRFEYTEYNERIRPAGYNEFKKNTKKIKDIESIINYICEKSNNIFNKNTVTIGHYINEGGALLEHSDYVVSDFIPVNEEEVISSNELLRFVSCYDKAKNFLTYMINKVTFTVPKNTEYIRLTINVNNYKDAMVTIGESVQEYEEYGDFKLKESETLKRTIKKCINEIKLTNIVDGLQVTTDTLNANNSLVINGFPNNLKKSISLSFYCKFDSFNEILIGKGYNSYRGDWLKITNTTITWQHYEQSIGDKTSVEHGLSLSNYIMITMYIDDNSKCTVNLMTLNGSFSTSFQFGYEVNGKPFVLSSSDINNAIFSITGQDFGKDIWMFGDSYFGVANNRIIGQLKNIGFTNVLIDGLAGQGSVQAYNELIMCLNFGTPKYLVWCLGMNDDDTSYTTNLNKVISLCENKNIKLIVMKIPTVPSRSKENINNFIETKGLRYIDAYKAVNANSNGEWYNNYLSSDGIHPTDMGAKAIAMRMIIDVPEIMQYGYSSKNVGGDISGDL